MKKLLAAAAVFAMGGVCNVQGEGASMKGAIVSVDSLAVMQKSLEGKELSGKIQQEIDSFQLEIKKAQKELADKQEALNKQSKVLSKDSFDQKVEELNSTRKSYEMTFAGKEEQLRGSIQKQQLALRDRQMKVIADQFKDSAAVLDKNAPGLLFVSNSIDKTEQVLKAVDDAFSTSKAVLAKATTPAAKVKTA